MRIERIYSSKKKKFRSAKKTEIQNSKLCGTMGRKRKETTTNKIVKRTKSENEPQNDVLSLPEATPTNPSIIPTRNQILN
jgi:hypothetical protein